ncbi:hypothetical protein BFW01_g1738 [Lasiodiplodia theobromae]|nr:hypothetical protein BFW01_g1738 [Lasiodiplodia theobromae]
MADEREERKREWSQLAAERDAFERYKEKERAAIEREKQTLEEERAETSRLKNQYVAGIAAYFMKKAEIEGGLIPDPRATDNSSIDHSADHPANSHADNK